MYGALLPAAAPFCWALSLRAIAGFVPCARDQQVDGEVLRKAFTLGGDTVAVAELAPARGGLSLTGHGVTDPVRGEELASAVRRWLSLDDDPAPYLARARADPAMAPVLAETEGLHQVRLPGLAEGASYFVLAQRSSQAQAGGRKRRLAAEFGPPPYRLDGVDHQAFPSLDRLAGLDVGRLAPFARNHRQAEYLVALLERLAGWEPDWGYRVPVDELLAELLSVRSVGEFTSRAIALRVLGRLDVVPESIPTFTRAIERLYGAGADRAVLARHYGDQVGMWGYHVRTGLGWAEGG